MMKTSGRTLEMSHEPTGTLSLGSQLCTQCGLCCTGALHNFAVLEPDELEFARELGLNLREDGQPGFALPCSYLQGCACTTYGRRPKVCGRYACQLLDDVREEKMLIDDALAHVKKAKELYRRVEALLPPGMTMPQARLRLKEPLEPGQAADERDRELRLRLELTIMCVYLDKHFKHWKESKFLTMRPIDQLETQG